VIETVEKEVVVNARLREALASVWLPPGRGNSNVRTRLAAIVDIAQVPPPEGASGSRSG
jgi:hypothetical protein